MASFVALLRQHHDLEQFVRPRVAAAAADLGGAETIELAGACLGNSYETVRALLKDGTIQAALTDDDRYRLEAAGRSGESDLDAYVAVLGLPRARTVETVEPPAQAVPAYPLFDHQVRAVRELHRLLDKRRVALLHMPTGAGKTRTSMNLVCDRLRASDDAVLWLASTRELCEQAAFEFATAWGHLGNRRVPVHSLWGGRSWAPSDVVDGLAIATPQTLHARLKRDGSASVAELGEGVGLIVFDEAHQAIAPTYESVVLNLRAGGQTGDTPLLGLSATPGRTFGGDDSDERLAAFFGGNKVELRTGPDGAVNPVRYLIDNGYLAEPDFRLLTPAGLTPSGVSVDASLYDAADDTSLEMDPTEYVRLVGQTVHELVAEGHRRIIVFAASVELSDDIAAVLSATGVIAESVHGATDPEMRAAAIERYRASGSTARVLINYGVLTTGFDAPQTSAAVIARPTRSLVLYSQMVGRAIRGRKAGGNVKATIVTVVDPEVPAFGSIAAAFTHWEDNWG